jgi:hypothetical protein
MGDETNRKKKRGQQAGTGIPMKKRHYIWYFFQK